MADSILDDLLAINSVCRVSTTPQSRDERTTGADDDRKSHEISISSDRIHSWNMSCRVAAVDALREEEIYML